MTIFTLNESQMLGQKPFIECPTNGWIAGGAIRRWFTGKEELSDIDCFFKSETDLNNFKIKIAGDPIDETTNAITVSLKNTRIQLIRVNFYQNIEELFDSFDFTCCQFSWDGKSIYSTTEATISVLRGHLGVNKIQEGFELDSLRRAFKYAKKGYYPCNGTLFDLARSFQSKTDEDLKAQTEISPGGGKRVIRID